MRMIWMKMTTMTTKIGKKKTKTRMIDKCNWRWSI
jgi:hypothetical protein